MTKKEIEPVLLKNIINKARVNFKEDISEAELNGWCKWYLINSTKCYEGLIDGINELLSGRVAELEKECKRLKGLVNDSFQMAMDFSYKEGLSHGHYKKAETLFNNFKTKNNL